MNRNDSEQIYQIIKSLNGIGGLREIYLLEENHKKLIDELEDKENLGVRECLQKEITLVAVHDSNFREPSSSLVVIEEDKIKFPSLPFTEMGDLDAISSSPSKKIHHLLEQIFNAQFNEEDATLLIGLNLKY